MAKLLHYRDWGQKFANEPDFGDSLKRSLKPSPRVVSVIKLNRNKTKKLVENHFAPMILEEYHIDGGAFCGLRTLT